MDIDEWILGNLAEFCRKVSKFEQNMGTEEAVEAVMDEVRCELEMED